MYRYLYAPEFTTNRCLVGRIAVVVDGRLRFLFVCGWRVLQVWRRCRLGVSHGVFARAK